MTGILAESDSERMPVMLRSSKESELKWKTLTKRRKANMLTLLYKCLKGKARISTDDLIPKK